MAEVTVLSTLPCHIAALNMRDADKSEIEAAGLRPGQALWHSYRHSFFSRTALVGKDVAAIWGLGGSPMGRIGNPWLLTAPPVEKVKHTFIRKGRSEVAEMLTICPTLIGVVDAKYLKAIRLLEMLGFEMDEPLPFGAHGAPFRRYHIERPI